MSSGATLETVLESLTARLGQASILETSKDPKDPRTLTVRIPGEQILPAAKAMKDLDFPYLSFITAVDFKRHIEMVYWFSSISFRLNLRVKCHLPPAAPRVQSLTGLFATADWNEREVFDMFGVEFANHPHLTRILTWEGFEGHPLLKKYQVIDEPDEFPQPAPKS